ncbi:MAG TPA: 6-pyruvoyl-tetrahydropterin synthase-related protein [Candidatus Acidoferrum sp.]|nr:6-pyruvoyl-tetrahydropterin synthase-related protein [Candidatus Acidoferrum sp.]
MTESPAAPPERRSTEGARAWLRAGMVSFATALAILAPFFWLGTASGHDISFHISSWFDAAAQWKEGILFPRWTEWANYGFGEPRFIFYPPLSWMLGAALGSVFPWTWVPPLFVLVVQTFAGISAFGLLRRTAGTFRTALFGAVAYAANPYALLVIYFRSDLAELLATSFLPLLFLAGLRLSGTLDGGPPTRKSILQFAILFAAVWLSNAPAGVLASYTLALLFFWAAATQKKLQPVLRGALGLALGLGLASFYLVPAAYEQRWVNITGALSAGLTPRENFLFAATADAEHDAFNRIASCVALLLIGGIAAAGLLVWKKRKTAERPESAERAVQTMLVLAVAAGAMMLPLTNIFWTILPKLRFVQFPWRLMMILAVVFAFLISSAARRAFALSSIVVVLLFTLTGAYLVKHAWWDAEDVSTVKEAMDKKAGFEGTDEYDPLGDDRTDVPQTQPEAKGIAEKTDSELAHKPEFQILRWTAEDRIVIVHSAGPARIRLRLLHYPAWLVTVNGAPTSTQRTVSYDAIVVAVPSGESRIEARFTRTVDRTIGGCISVLSALAGAFLMWPRNLRQA